MATSSIFGILLLILSLISDGLLADKQHTLFEKFNTKNKRFNQFALMKYTTKFTCIFCFVYGFITFQILEFYKYVSEYPDVLYDIFLFAVMGSLG